MMYNIYFVENLRGSLKLYNLMIVKLIGWGKQSNQSTAAMYKACCALRLKQVNDLVGLC